MIFFDTSPFANASLKSILIFPGFALGSGLAWSCSPKRLSAFYSSI